jgi:hypothetical protein
MGQPPGEITQNLAERVCWEVARRDDARVARRLYRKQPFNGVYRLDEGALLDDFFHFLQAIGVMELVEAAHGAALQREMLPFVQYVLLYGVKTLFRIESINALPSLLFSDEALMSLVGFNPQQARQGICQRGATTRQGERSPGPMCPDTLAKTIVQWNVRDLEVGSNGSIRVLAKPELWREGHGHGGGHRSGDDRARYRLWPGHAHGAHRGQAGPGARDRGHRLWLENAHADRCRHHASPARQGGEDARA